MMVAPRLIQMESDDGRLLVKLTTFGASIFGVEVPDRDGVMMDVALGCDRLEDFVHNAAAFGATCGRYANRIAGGKFMLDGTEYTLAQNNGPNCLHGGEASYHGRIWEVLDQREVDGRIVSVTFHLLSPDGDGGFPGELHVTARYAMEDDGGFSVSYEARTSKPTVVNLTNHVYWNLSGDFSKTIEDHQLVVPAYHFLPIDDNHLVTGEIREVRGTVFDFRNGANLGDVLEHEDPQIATMRGLDHAMLVNGENSRLGARLEHPASGRCLEITTDQPAVHVYSGGFLDSTVPGKGGARIDRYAAIALESENLPDAPNQPDFPSAVLRLGETYRHKISWKFGVVK